MPTPRQHGGAALAQFPLVLPGFKGLNTQNAGALLGPEWATRLQNTIIDSSGRLAARKGWVSQAITPHDNAFVSGIEYRRADGTVSLIGITDSEFMVSVNNGNSWTDMTDDVTITDGNWNLFNFNDYVIGLQQESQPILFDGTDTIHISDNGDEPTGGAGIGAFGRVWASDQDRITLKYSALLDPTDWSSQDAGSFDLSDIWPGTDSIVAVAAYNNFLVVFGNRNIIIYGDGTGSTLGIDPTAMYVVDTVPGIGCLSQNSIQTINGDLWFLSNTRELMSLERVLLQQKSGGLKNLSSNVSDFLRDTIDNGSFQYADLRSAYSPKDRFYLLSLPTESSPGAADETGRTFVFDTRGFLEDGSARCVGVWTNLVPTVFWMRDSGDMYTALRSYKGEVGRYALRQDNGRSYRLAYESGWQDITQQGYMLILKRLNGLFYLDRSTEAVMKWAFDFNTVFHTQTISFEHQGSTAEFGIAEFGISEFGGGVTLNNKKVAGRGTGEYIKVGVEATINGADFSIQQIDLLAKVGRLI